jgi:hypothetical protein
MGAGGLDVPKDESVFYRRSYEFGLRARKGDESNTWKISMLTALIFTIRSMSAYET